MDDTLILIGGCLFAKEQQIPRLQIIITLIIRQLANYDTDYGNVIIPAII